MNLLKTVLCALLLFAAVAALAGFAVLGLPVCWLKVMDDSGIVLGYFLSCLSIALAILAWIRKAEFRRFLSGLFRRSYVGVGEPLSSWTDRTDAMVIPVSRREQPEWILRHLQPEKVSFLFTERSREIAVALAREFSDRIHFFPTVAQMEAGESLLDSPDDPKKSKDLVDGFLSRFEEQGVPREKILVDTTGGKVPMSVGAFVAAEEHGISSIYVVGTVLSKTGDAIIQDPQKQDHGRPVFLSEHAGD